MQFNESEGWAAPMTMRFYCARKPLSNIKSLSHTRLTDTLCSAELLLIQHGALGKVPFLRCTDEQRHVVAEAVPHCSYKVKVLLLAAMPQSTCCQPAQYQTCERCSQLLFEDSSTRASRGQHRNSHAPKVSLLIPNSVCALFFVFVQYIFSIELHKKLYNTVGYRTI